MKRLRIGKDFAVRWSIYSKTDSGRKPYALDPENSLLRLVTPHRKEEVKGFLIEDNTLTWVYRGRDQKLVGVYDLELVERNGANGMITIDTCKAFELVAHTCEETDNDNGDIVIDSLEFDSEVTLAPLGYGGAVQVDEEMSDDSENPVQNKVVKAYVDDAVADKQDTIADLEDIRQGAAAGATALQNVPEEYVTENDFKTINGQPILGSGDLEINPGVSEDDIISNEKVTAAALNDLDTRIKKLPTNDTVANTIAEALAAERAQQEANMAALQEQIAALSEELVIMRAESASNEKVTAAALNDLNNRLNS